MTSLNHHQATTAESSDDGQKVMCLRLSGETVSGECLSVAGGEMVSGSCTYQWQRVVPASGGIERIVGAVGPSYVTDDRDIGCHIRVIVRMMRRRRTTNGRRRNKSEGGYHRPVIAHATTDATVVAAVSSKHPDDERVLASDATGEGRRLRGTTLVERMEERKRRWFNDEWEHAEKREYAYIREERLLREQQWGEREQRSFEGRYGSEKSYSIADFVNPEWDGT